MEQEHRRFVDTNEVVMVPAVHEGSGGGNHQPRETQPRDQSEIGREPAGVDRELRDSHRKRFKRSLRLDETSSPRVSDFARSRCLDQRQGGDGERGRGPRVQSRDSLIKKAVQNTFGRYFSPREFDAVLMRFRRGADSETGSDVLPPAIWTSFLQMANMREMVGRIESSSDPSAVASAIEFILEGLYLTGD